VSGARGAVRGGGGRGRPNSSRGGTPVWILPAVAAALGGFAIAYLVVLFFVFPVSGQPEEVKVPNVLGLTYDEAATRLTGAGFRAQQGESRYNVGSPRNKVLSQTPAAAIPAAKGTRVILDVSAGQRRAATPNVIGMDRDSARRTLAKVGLEVGQVTEHESPLPRGEVITMTPAAGTQLILPSAISLIVSTGPATLQVPYLVGRPFAEARAALEQLGLTAAAGGVDSTSSEPLGTVTSQLPLEGAAVPPGTAITLTTSAGTHRP
jgi:eukaryotic-like serine/threonine-protein kinase